MLCRKKEYRKLEKRKNGEWIGELKFDGTRALAYVRDGEYKLVNRRNFEISRNFPELKFPDVNAILDGELVIFTNGKSDFSKILTRTHITNNMKIRLLSKRYPATFMVFDILYIENNKQKKLLNLPLIERKKILEEIEETENVKIVDYVEGEEIIELWNEAKEKDLEGVILKEKDSKYKCGERSDKWIKIKTLETGEFKIVGYRESESRALRSLVLMDNSKNYVGRVGTGFSDEYLKELKGKLDKLKTNTPKFKELDKKYDITWVEPDLECEVEYLEKKEHLRQPSFKKLI